MSVIANHLATAWDWLDLDSSVQPVLGNPPKVLTDYAREFNEELDSYPTFVAGFTRTAVQSEFPADHRGPSAQQAVAARHVNRHLRKCRFRAAVSRASGRRA